MKRLENGTSQGHISRKEGDDDYGKCIFCCGKFSRDTFGVEWIQRLGCNDWRREECYEAKHKIKFKTVFLQGVYSKIRIQLWKFSRILEMYRTYEPFSLPVDKFSLFVN